MCSSRKGLKIEAVDVNIPLPSRVPGCDFSFSDHEPVSAKFRILEDPQASNQEKDQLVRIDSLKEALQVCDVALKNLANDKRNYWLVFVVIVVLLAALQFSHGESNLLHYTLVVSHLLLVILALFCFVMATVWNRIERHGIVAGKLGISTRLNFLLNSKIDS